MATVCESLKSPGKRLTVIGWRKDSACVWILWMSLKGNAAVEDKHIPRALLADVPGIFSLFYAF